MLTPLGASIETMDGPPGLAAERKLLRSVFFKGLAAAVVEALAAARAAGCEDWLRNNIAEELTRADESTVERLVTGTHRHAVRRADEMAAATAMLEELGVEPTISAATQHLLTGLTQGSR
jgi:3-hydroxyisobutyrate dehydrogenase-like beta-hydroxyacid dehydrogenase